MFDIRSDEWADKRINIDLNEFKKGIDFAYKNKCDGITLSGPVGKKEYSVDFNLFEKLGDTLSFLSIPSTVKLEDQKNMDGLYSLKKLKKLVLESQKPAFDLSLFPQLKQISIEYWPGLKGMVTLKNLEALVLRKFPGSDLEELKPLTSLKRLHIYQSKIKTVRGLGNFQKLEELNLSYNNNLSDLPDIDKVSSLKKIHIEKCEKLADVKFKKCHIKELFISKIHSLDNILELKYLELLTFWDLEDGDLTPALKLQSIKEIRFHPQKKNYTHTKEQINLLITKRK